MKLLAYGATRSHLHPVPEKLLAAGREVCVLTCDPARVVEPKPDKVVQGDIADAASLVAATRDLESVFLHVPFFTPGRGVTYARNALDAALQKVPVTLTSLEGWVRGREEASG